MKHYRQALPTEARYLAVTLVALLLLSMANNQGAKAQSRVVWSRPVNLSNSATNSIHPAIVADDFGFVHVFWSEDVGGEPVPTSDLGDPGNAIVYMRWDGSSWTLPADVVSVPGERNANFVAADVDNTGRLHIVFGGQSDFYYSSADGLEANRAQAWSDPRTIAGDNARTSFESDLVVSTDGKIHVTYAARGLVPGIYHIESIDGGALWSQPRLISEPLDTLETAFSNVRLIQDRKGRLHVTWQTVQEAGYGQGVYYARSLDGAISWDNPTRFDYLEQAPGFVEWPYLTARGDDELHLTYANGDNKGRGYRVSSDAGATWSAEQDVLMDMEGINGFIPTVVDSSGQLHMIVNMRKADNQVVGIYYSLSTPAGWTIAQPVDTISPGAPTAHYAASSVRLGSEIHTVYTQLRGGEIWYVRGIIENVAQVTPLPLPARTPEVVASLTEPDAVLAEPTVRPTLTPSLESNAGQGDTTFLSIAVAASTAFLFVAFAVLFAIRKR